MRQTILAFALPLALAACGSDGPTAATPDLGGTDANGVPMIVGWRTNSDGNSGTIASVTADGSNYHVLATTSQPTGWVATSYTGRVVVYSDGSDPDAQQLDIIDQSGSKRTLVAPSSQIASAFAPTFSPDSQWIYFRGTTADDPSMSRIWRVKLDGSGLAGVSEPRSNGIGAPSIASDGLTVLETTSDSVVFTIIASGATHGVAVHCPGAQYSPDGLHVSCVSGGDLVVYDAQFQQAPRYLGDGTYSESAGTDWTPDGSKILVTSTANGPELVSYADGTVISANLGTTYTNAAFVK
jgi:Tol biopolymer transport system component